MGVAGCGLRASPLSKCFLHPCYSSGTEDIDYSSGSEDIDYSSGTY